MRFHLTCLLIVLAFIANYIDKSAETILADAFNQDSENELIVPIQTRADELILDSLEETDSVGSLLFLGRKKMKKTATE